MVLFKTLAVVNHVDIDDGKKISHSYYQKGWNTAFSVTITVNSGHPATYHCCWHDDNIHVRK